MLALAGQPPQLPAEDRPLPLGHADVRAQTVVLVPHARLRASAVAERPQPLGHRVVCVVAQPPSPELITLDAWKLNVPTCPMPPAARLPRRIAPAAWQASSMTTRLCLRAIAMMASMSHSSPPRCTTMMARVLGVMASSMRADRD